MIIKLMCNCRLKEEVNIIIIMKINVKWMIAVGSVLPLKRQLDIFDK